MGRERRKKVRESKSGSESEIGSKIERRVKKLIVQVPQVLCTLTLGQDVTAQVKPNLKIK